MPTNRRSIWRHRKSIVPLDSTVVRFLLYGADEPGTPGGDLRRTRFFDGGAAIRAAWGKHKAELMRVWNAEHRAGLPWVVGFNLSSRIDGLQQLERGTT